ncbi:hypothetical protein B9Z55_022090 [Caenorhabditis nigoni]|uniref:Uncharacterized protein n=1 Tax=Caenorhabditis nigoni TaxID=1611254 RepID=A0A2G5TUR9_9PELO|nr:hypothetical protein B9Z55_022090 [Caenorhabditis nigoni]
MDSSTKELKESKRLKDESDYDTAAEDTWPSLDSTFEGTKLSIDTAKSGKDGSVQVSVSRGGASIIDKTNRIDPEELSTIMEQLFIKDKEEEKPEYLLEKEIKTESNPKFLTERVRKSTANGLSEMTLPPMSKGSTQALLRDKKVARRDPRPVFRTPDASFLETPETEEPDVTPTNQLSFIVAEQQLKAQYALSDHTIKLNNETPVDTKGKPMKGLGFASKIQEHPDDPFHNSYSFDSPINSVGRIRHVSELTKTINARTSPHDGTMKKRGLSQFSNFSFGKQRQDLSRFSSFSFKAMIPAHDNSTREKENREIEFEEKQEMRDTSTSKYRMPRSNEFRHWFTIHVAPIKTNDKQKDWYEALSEAGVEALKIEFIPPAADKTPFAIITLDTHANVMRMIKRRHITVNNEERKISKNKTNPGWFSKSTTVPRYFPKQY